MAEEFVWLDGFLAGSIHSFITPSSVLAAAAAIVVQL